MSKGKVMNINVDTYLEIFIGLINDIIKSNPKFIVISKEKIITKFFIEDVEDYNETINIVNQTIQFGFPDFGLIEEIKNKVKNLNLHNTKIEMICCVPDVNMIDKLDFIYVLEKYCRLKDVNYYLSSDTNNKFYFVLYLNKYIDYDYEEYCKIMKYCSYCKLTPEMTFTLENKKQIDKVDLILKTA